MEQMLNNKKDIDAWCKAMNIFNYLIQEDLSIKVFQDVDISNKKISKLPVKFLKTTGNFNCSENSLTSLENVPIIVGSTFNCSKNKLTSLLHSPKKVAQDFNCSFNKINSLKHITPVIVGNLNCSNNPLDSLEYCPYIGYSLLCHNCSLTTLEGCPSVINGTLGCTGNKLINLHGAPDNVKLHLHCDKNPISSIQGCPKTIGGEFHIGGNKILDIDLLNTIVGEEMMHYADSNEERIEGFEHLYVYKRNWITLNISKKMIKSIILNKSLTESLLIKKTNIQKRKI